MPPAQIPVPEAGGRARLALATGSREVIRTDIVVRNSRGVDCYSANAMDLAERWAIANADRGPFTIERVQIVRLRTVLASTNEESARAEASNARILAGRGAA